MSYAYLERYSHHLYGTEKSKLILQRNSNTQPLIRKATLKHLAKLVGLTQGLSVGLQAK